MIAKYVAAHCRRIGAATLVLVCLIPNQALPAEYRYEYIGKLFTQTEVTCCHDGPPPFDGVVTVTGSTRVAAVIETRTPLLSGSTWDPSIKFQIGGEYYQEQLEYPWPFPIDPTAGPGEPGNPNYIGTFFIGNVDPAGLPTDWSIGVSYSYSAPTGRYYFRHYATSTTLDEVEGGYEGFHYFSGQGNGNPGEWRLSVVPEPDAALMLSAGLAVLAMQIRMYRRRLEAQGATLRNQRTPNISQSDPL